MSFEPLPKDLEDSLLCLHELLTDESPTYGDVETWLPAFDELRKRGYLCEPSKLRMGGGGFFVLSNEGLRYFDRKTEWELKKSEENNERHAEKRSDRIPDWLIAAFSGVSGILLTLLVEHILIPLLNR